MRGGRTQIAPEDNKRVEDEPMSQQQNELDKCDAQNRPSFQTKNSLLQFLHGKRMEQGTRIARCGRIHRDKQEVSGHDFSRAAYG